MPSFRHRYSSKSSPPRAEQLIEASLASQQILLELGYWVSVCQRATATEGSSPGRINERCTLFERSLNTSIREFSVAR